MKTLVLRLGAACLLLPLGACMNMSGLGGDSKYACKAPDGVVAEDTAVLQSADEEAAGLDPHDRAGLGQAEWPRFRLVVAGAQIVEHRLMSRQLLRQFGFQALQAGGPNIHARAGLENGNEPGVCGAPVDKVGECARLASPRAEQNPTGRVPRQAGLRRVGTAAIIGGLFR